jgi:hypothetical protein
MSYPNHPQGGPAGAPPNMAASFNAMLQRSMQDPPPPEPVSEAPGSQPQAIGRSLCTTKSNRNPLLTRLGRIWWGV